MLEIRLMGSVEEVEAALTTLRATLDVDEDSITDSYPNHRRGDERVRRYFNATLKEPPNADRPEPVSP